MLVLEPGNRIETVWSSTLALYIGCNWHKILSIDFRLAGGILGVVVMVCGLQIKWENGKFVRRLLKFVLGLKWWF